MGQKKNLDGEFRLVCISCSIPLIGPAPQTYHASLNANVPFTAICLAHAGLLAAATADGAIRFYKLKTHALVRTVRYPELKGSWLPSLAVHPADPRTLLVASGSCLE